MRATDSRPVSREQQPFQAVKETRAQCSIHAIERSPDSGNLWVGEMNGKVITVSCSGSEIAGVFTHYGGTQTVLFRSRTGEDFRCPGKFYFALANFFGPSERRSGGVDWAFVITQNITVPEWVEHFGEQSLSRYPNNTFLAPGKNFTGTTKATLGPGGRFVKVEPKPGEEFGADKKLLLVGKMQKSAEAWMISTD